ncbi:hypothetical protein CISIN_1g039152mg, partial [Citrus sinensis]
LGLFQGIKNIKEARARVHTLVNKLKAFCMLLDDDENIFMHDVACDVAISITSREQNMFTATDELVSGWEWSDEGRKNSFFAIPQNLLRSMLQVRVLDLTDMNLLSLPSSIGLLTNLHTLCLYSCILKDMAVISDLKKLEILCLHGSSIYQLPVEVGQLTQLRSLDLRHCSNLQVIPLNKHLPNLTSLELEVNDANTLPRGGLFLEKPERIDLDANVRLKDQDTVQLWGIEELSLAELLDHIKNFVNKLVKVGSSQLKYL